MDLGKLLTQSTKKPKNVLQIVLSVSVVLLVLWLFMVSRMELSNTNTLLEQEARIDSVQSVRGTLLNEPEQVTIETAAEQETSTIFQNAFTTFMVMIGLLGIVWWVSKRKSNSRPTNSSDIKEIDQYVIGQGAQLKFIEVNGEIWVLGVSPQVLNLLHRIPKQEWKTNQENVQEESVVDQKTDFKSIYKLLGN